MSIWTIQGEAGKGLDAAIRDLSEVAIAPRLIRRVLDTSTLSWQTLLRDLIPGPDEIIPSWNQAVTLRRNSIVFWRGHVRNIRKVKTAVSIEAHDAWWIAEKMPMSSVQVDGVGTSRERASFGFPAQSLSASITSLFNRTVAMGVPWKLGKVATTWNFPPMKLTQQYCGAALTELVRMCPDMETVTDYSTNPPTVHFLRRKRGLGSGSAPSVTFDARELADYDVASRMEHKVSQVRVPYVDRAPNGMRRFQEQAAGTPVLSEVQMVTVSGAELDTFLPQDELDSVLIRTIATNSMPATILQFLNSSNEVLAQLRAKHGNTWFGGNVVGQYLSDINVSGGESLPYHASTPSASTQPSLLATFPISYSIGDQILSDVKHIVASSEPIPDWLQEKNGIRVYDGTLTADVYVRLQWKSSLNTQPNIPGLGDFMGSTGEDRQNYWNVFGASYEKVSYFVYKVKQAVKLLDVSYPNWDTIYRKPDYAFIAPPAGFAEGLLGAQNWVPFEGHVELEENEAGGTVYSGKLINLSNDLPEYATMDALVSAEEIDIDAGTTRIYLGAPARINYRDLADKLRPNSNDQIVYL